MLKPSFRFFIVPLGAVATLATLSAQNVTPRAQRDNGSTFVREQVVDRDHGTVVRHLRYILSHVVLQRELAIVCED